MSAPLTPAEHDLVGRAAALARAAHEGQRDKAGRPYFDSHVADVHRRVVAYGGDVHEQVAALLHDVLEDTEVTEDDLVAAGVPEQAIQVVRLLTKVDGEPVQAYYERIRAHEPARRVKLLGDLASNTDPARTALLPEAQRLRLTAKYDQARRLLEA